MGLEVKIPAKLAPLLRPARYKAVYGGRGSAKSHTFATLAVMTNLTFPARGVCIREVQNSIKDSVKQLIEDKIDQHGLNDHFEVLRDEIRGRNGSLMIFKGMQAYNADNIKSLEGFDWAWWEEAQTAADRSLRLLRPTLREGKCFSQIGREPEMWFGWNPRHDTDPVDKFFRGSTPPANSVVIECNWQDNPWFPETLRREKDHDYAVDPDMADHVWGGGYEVVSEGAYYANLIAQAEREGRIGDFPYSPRQPVKTSWDLGIDDYTAVWFWQDDGFKATVIDYYETGGDGYDDIVAAVMPEVFMPPAGEEEKWHGWNAEAALKEIGRSVSYRYASHYMPHDVANREQGAGGRHRWQTLNRLGVKPIRVGVAVNPEERINAVRDLMPAVRFNDTPRVQVGLRRLRMYRKKFNDRMGVYQGPLHDDASHGADAFGEYAINARIAPPKPEPEPKKTDDLVIVTDRQTGQLVTNMGVKEWIAAKQRRKRRTELGL